MFGGCVDIFLCSQNKCIFICFFFHFYNSKSVYHEPKLPKLLLTGFFFFATGSPILLLTAVRFGADVCIAVVFKYFPTPDRNTFSGCARSLRFFSSATTFCCLSISSARSLASISSASWNGSTKMCAFSMVISSMGRSLLSTSIFSISLSVSIPPTNFPKIVCFPSKFRHDRYVMKLKNSNEIIYSQRITVRFIFNQNITYN